ncbi:TerC/Alx family metal homeostasis membrane protein [Clostridium felsineum]|uniref:TerC/Alx family metal homeostasis membrane protein n=1 Tax=Clostridium felsineum TaxID=36839 RepID=UPI00098C78EE|nr:TerC/Alx family metal homeostasis membrane protein [Clostridium felsineum]URZ18299.1 Putative membrane-bound redox modulator Alx [Clostridium felsineum DSM 794]
MVIIDTRKALKQTLIWIALALVFNIFIYFFMGKQNALEFLGGYVIELSLSLDNLFLFLIIFQNFLLKGEHQKKILNYGILGAVILRLIFILLGVAVIDRFHFILYFFGILLIISGIKMFLQKEDEKKDYKNSFFFKMVGRFIPVEKESNSNKFLIRKKGKLHATPLLPILVLIEGSDLLFAVDSIPAIFSITTNAFIVYTSNIFAILGLRSMYFLLEKLHDKFQYVKFGVALILIFTGIKLAILFFHIEISIILSLTIIFVILALSIIFSMLKNKNGESY